MTFPSERGISEERLRSALIWLVKIADSVKCAHEHERDVLRKAIKDARKALEAP